MKLQKEYPKIEILENTEQYHGPKLIALYDYAIKNKCDYIFQTDSDGQTNPDEFAAFWNMRKEYSGIFGNRTVRGDGHDRAFVEKVVCFLLRMYFGVKVRMQMHPFRLMKTDVVKNISIDCHIIIIFLILCWLLIMLITVRSYFFMRYLFNHVKLV